MDNISFHFLSKPFKPKKIRKLKLWLTQIANNYGFTIQEINYIFCTDEELLEINQNHLKHNFYTDIITFPYNTNKAITADLYISIDRVKDNAKRLNQTFQNELHRVMVHGLLHMVGFNDKTAKQKLQMTQAEDKSLNLRPF